MKKEKGKYKLVNCDGSSISGRASNQHTDWTRLQAIDALVVFEAFYPYSFAWAIAPENYIFTDEGWTDPK